MERRYDEILLRLGELQGRVNSIDARLARMEQMLTGDGRNGVLSKLASMQGASNMARWFLMLVVAVAGVVASTVSFVVAWLGR